MSDKDVRWLEIEVDDARVVDKMQTLNGERRGNPKSQVSLMALDTNARRYNSLAHRRASQRLGTDAKPEADQGQNENHVGRTLLKSAIIFQTRASSSWGNVRPYSHRK